jgi:hypothetical protein
MKKGLIIFMSCLLIAGFFFYREYSRTNPDLKKRNADHSYSVMELIEVFENDSAASNNKLNGKVLAVSGNIKTIDAFGNPVVIVLGESGQMSSVLCSMDSTHAPDYMNLREGDKVIIKGICTGGETLDMFGTDIKLNRCVVEKKD